PSEYYGVDGQLIKRLGSVPPPYPQAWVPNLVFTQPAVERILRDGAARRDTVSVALATELIDLVQGPDHVDLGIRHVASNTSRVRARYVVGCDGASSLVRTIAGIEYEDLEFDEPWLVVDLLVNERGLLKLPDVRIQYSYP